MSASTITLTDLLPAVFADERERHTSSEVWLTSLRFDRGGRYLVQAESGKGKTSLCAFISVSGDGHSTVSPAPDASPHAATTANVKVLRFSIITSPLQLNHLTT